MHSLKSHLRSDLLAQLVISRPPKEKIILSFNNKFEWELPSADFTVWLSLPEWQHPYRNYRKIAKLAVFWADISNFVDEAIRVLDQYGYTAQSLIDPQLLLGAIIEEHSNVQRFWSKAHGWAPDEAAELLAKSRLDRLVSLAHCLKLWMEANPEDNEGRLILAWANLGALVEGSLKFFLCVFLKDYRKNPVVKNERIGKLDPDALQLADLKKFYDDNVWQKHPVWSPWLEKIIQRRNSIHAFQQKEIDNFLEFHRKLEEYLRLISYLFGRLPYPELG